MKIIAILLVALLLVSEFQLWFGSGGVVQSARLKHAIALQEEQNEELFKQNQRLEKEIVILKNGRGVVENLAREQMGMVKPGEKYYQFIQSKVKDTMA